MQQFCPIFLGLTEAIPLRAAKARYKLQQGNSMLRESRALRKKRSIPRTLEHTAEIRGLRVGTGREEESSNAAAKCCVVIHPAKS